VGRSNVIYIEIESCLMNKLMISLLSLTKYNICNTLLTYSPLRTGRTSGSRRGRANDRAFASFILSVVFFWYRTMTSLFLSMPLSVFCSDFDLLLPLWRVLAQ
jgi:hypothetical protein